MVRLATSIRLKSQSFPSSLLLLKTFPNRLLIFRWSDEKSPSEVSNKRLLMCFIYLAKRPLCSCREHLFRPSSGPSSLDSWENLPHSESASCIRNKHKRLAELFVLFQTEPVWKSTNSLQLSSHQVPSVNGAENSSKRLLHIEHIQINSNSGAYLHVQNTQWADWRRWSSPSELSSKCSFSSLGPADCLELCWDAAGRVASENKKNKCNLLRCCFVSNSCLFLPLHFTFASVTMFLPTSKKGAKILACLCPWDI